MLSDTAQKELGVNVAPKKASWSNKAKLGEFKHSLGPAQQSPRGRTRPKAGRKNYPLGNTLLVQ